MTMKPFSSARRRGRVVGHDEDEADVQMAEADHSAPGTITPRPTLQAFHTDSTPLASAVKRPSAKPKKSSSSRLSFGLSGASAAEQSSSSEVFTPKKSNLSRQAQERNALKRSGLASSVSTPDVEDSAADGRPSYSKEYLAELKNSTPSLSSRQQSPSSEAGRTQTLDVAAKFGTDLSRYQDRNGSSAIPTEAEIQEKKARRARLAKEQKYQSKDPNSSDEGDEDDLPDQGQDSDDDEFATQRDIVSFNDKSKHPETRLAHDDEDIMEDFDSFVDDGRIKLGRKAENEQQQRQREEMRDLIAEAEGSSSDDSNDSEKRRRDAYEAAQTRKGMEGLRVGDAGPAPDPGARTPPKIIPLPSLSSCTDRLRAALQELQASRRETVDRLAEIEAKRREIPAQEEEIQARLMEAGEAYERLRAAAGLNGATTNGASGAPAVDDQLGGQRGLESLGNMPEHERSDENT